MNQSGHTLLRDWDRLQEQVVQPLLQPKQPGRKRPGQSSVWSIGSAADAVTIAIAYRCAHGNLADIEVFASDLGSVHQEVSFSSADISSIPTELRDECLSRADRRWKPEEAIADRVIFAEPAQEVDLVTLRPGSKAAQHRSEAFDHLRVGGRLVTVADASAGGVELTISSPLLDKNRTASRPREGSTPADLGGPGKPEPTSGQCTTLKDVQRRAQLVNGHLRLASALAKRFAHRGERLEDLEQVARYALIKAARGFDPSRNVAFSTYASASVVGELKRHFRDKTWTMRVPRSLQERYLEARRASEQLTHELGAFPTVTQIAAYLDVDERSVLDALHAGDDYWIGSLDTSLPDNVPAEIPVVDTAFDECLNRQSLRNALSELDSRSQFIVKRAYFDRRTQREVAEEIGVSQMQVSRLLSRSISKLRQNLDMDSRADGSQRQVQPPN